MPGNVKHFFRKRSKLGEFVDVGHAAAEGIDDLAVGAGLPFELVEVRAVLAADVVGGITKLRLVESALGLGRACAAVEKGDDDLVFFHGFSLLGGLGIG